MIINGVTFEYPQLGDLDWADEATGWASAVTQGMLQKAGGSFTLTAEVDFGATFGLRAAYLRSKATNPAGTGFIRLGNTQNISWRNFANSADLPLSVNASNQLTFNGAVIPTTGGFTDLIPAIDNTYDIGSGSFRWKDFYLAGVASIGTLNVSGTTTLDTSLTGVVKAVSGLISASSIVNADVSASAAIAGTKISPNFGAQTVTTSVDINAASAVIGFGATNSGSGTVNIDNSAAAGLGSVQYFNIGGFHKSYIGAARIANVLANGAGAGDTVFATVSQNLMFAASRFCNASNSRCATCSAINAGSIPCSIPRLRICAMSAAADC